ncbi:MAG: Sulfur carrier protein adenylyltransferase ThiF [Gemmatimonadetes bacterium]|nr:Sulfur carrier protein adenylyltransferase ThiF [Gemmatimonadota bacterium]
MSSRFGMRPRKRPAAARPAGQASEQVDTAPAPEGDPINAPAVPSRASWWDRFRPLFLREIASARELGLVPRIAAWPLDVAGTRTVERLIVSGRVRVKAARPGEGEKWYGLDFDFSYPTNYPFDKLDVRPCDTRIRRRRHQTANGDLCFMQEELEPWAVGYGIARGVDGARAFVAAEVTGKFAHEVPAAELIAYLPRETAYVRGVLLPPHAVWTKPPATTGTMKLEWDKWGEQPALALLGPFAPAAADLNDRPMRDTNDRLWEALRLRQNPVRPNKYNVVDGLWFALDSEPSPFTDFTGFEVMLCHHLNFTADAIDKLLEAALTKGVRERGWFPIALSYPRRTTGAGATVDRIQREWLFINLEWPKLIEDRVRKNHLRATLFRPRLEVRGVPSYSVSAQDLARRVGPIYEHDSVARARVVIVGLGALGSTVARSLAAAGVRDFVLVDPDVVKPGNVVRHEGRLPDVGRMKVRAMHQILRETNPHVSVQTLLGTRAESGAFETVLLDRKNRPALVVATVALKAVDGQIDDVARQAEPPLPVLHAWVTAQAQVARAFLTIPGRTACLYCNGLYEKAADGTYIIAPDVEAEPFFEASCVDPTFPGAGNANALAAHVITEMALDILHDRLVDEESHWVFAGNRVGTVAPGYAVPPLTVVRSGFRPHPECPVCSTRELLGSLDETLDALFHKELDRLRETP